MVQQSGQQVQLMCGDCLELMKAIPTESVHAAISDIPYGINYDSWDVTHNNTNSALLGSSPAQSSSSLFKTRGKPLNGWSSADKSRGVEFEQWCSGWLVELYRVLMPASPLLIMTGRQNQHRFINALESVGFVYKDYLVWDKVTAPFRAQNVNKVLEKRGVVHDGNYRLGNLAPLHEPIVYAFKPYKQGGTVTDCYLKDGVGCFDADVLSQTIIRVPSKISGKQHETQKPVELFEVLVKLVTKENHILIDPFMGSGTTGVAARNLGRSFIGMEKEQKYYDIACNRLNGGNNAI